MVNHPQSVFEIHESQLARIAPHQIAGHVIPSGHITIHKIRQWRTHLRILRDCAQHHESSPVLFFQFIQKADQQRSHLPSGVTGALETSLVPSVITTPWNSIILRT